MSVRVATTIAACAAVAALVVGVVLGTYVAGGSDSSCYLNAARLLARGTVGLDQPLARDAPWPHADQTFTPAGFSPSAIDPAFFVPICSPGLPLLMALFRRLHVSEFLVVPLLGALAVWLTYVVGRAIDRPITGAAAAVLLVCSPTFLYQVVQPMSDVPAMAWWLLVMVCTIEREDGSNRPALAGLAASMALLTRPNLLPLAVVVATYLLIRGAGSGLTSVARTAIPRETRIPYPSRRLEGSRIAIPDARSAPKDDSQPASGSAGHATSRAGALGWFAVGLAPGILLLAWLQRAMYGSPLATGYGSVGGLMAASHVLPNLRRYSEWLMSSHTPFLLLAAAAPAIVPRARQAWLCLAVAAATLACYLPYRVFEDWWYTRFLLPAIPLLIVLSAAVLVGLAARLAPRRQAFLTVACVMILIAFWIPAARAGHAFDLAAMEQHYARAGTAIADHVTGPAAIVTLKNSGSVLYHSGRSTLSWDTLDPGSLDQALAFVRDRGDTPYLLLELDEESAFRERFRGASVLGNLDWPPRIQVGRTIRLYDPVDRAQFLKDGQVRTAFISDAPVPSRDWRRWLGIR